MQLAKRNINNLRQDKLPKPRTFSLDFRCGGKEIGTRWKKLRNKWKSNAKRFSLPKHFLRHTFSSARRTAAIHLLRNRGEMICERTRERSAFILFSSEKTHLGNWNWMVVGDFPCICALNHLGIFFLLPRALFPIHFYLHSNGRQVTRLALVFCTVNKTKSSPFLMRTITSSRIS